MQVSSSMAEALLSPRSLLSERTAELATTTDVMPVPNGAEPSAMQQHSCNADGGDAASISAEIKAQEPPQCADSSGVASPAERSSGTSCRGNAASSSWASAGAAGFPDLTAESKTRMQPQPLPHLTLPPPQTPAATPLRREGSPPVHAAADRGRDEVRQAAAVLAAKPEGWGSDADDAVSNGGGFDGDGEWSHCSDSFMELSAELESHDADWMVL